MDIINALSDSWLASVLVFLITFLTVYYTTRRRAGVPPGPPLLPVVGNLLSLAGKDLFGRLDGLRARYGDIFALYIGTELTIFLNGHDVIHDALIKKGSQFVRRPYTSNFHKLVIKDPLIVFGNDTTWKEQKSFTQKGLQELCFKRGGQNIQHVINTEGVHLVDKLSELSEPFDIDEYITVSATNVISNVLFKHRFEFGDKEIITIMKLISESAREVLRHQLLSNCFPYLYNLPVDVCGYGKMDKKCYRGVMTRLEPYLEVNKENTDTLLGLYRTRISELEDSGVTNTSFTKFHLHKLCYELIGTGSETTGTTLRWILLYLLRQPEIQEKMYREIERELGTDQLPCLSDKSKLPFTHAATLEGLRIANVAPLAIPHSPSDDLIFRGHLFPKNCTVMINLNSALKDPNVWKDPEIFRPERFLNEEQTEVVIPKEFIPFSMGPRACPGETLARTELFLLMTILVQRFQFLPEKDDFIPNIEGNLGLTWSPKPFKLRAKCRRTK